MRFRPLYRHIFRQMKSLFQFSRHEIRPSGAPDGPSMRTTFNSLVMRFALSDAVAGLVKLATFNSLVMRFFATVRTMKCLRGSLSILSSWDSYDEETEVLTSEGLSILSSWDSRGYLQKAPPRGMALFQFSRHEIPTHLRNHS
jgi:hypothetical protein